MLLIGSKERLRLFLPLEYRGGYDSRDLGYVERCLKHRKSLNPDGNERRCLQTGRFNCLYTNKERERCQVDNDILTQQLERLLNTDVNDSTMDNKMSASVEDKRALHVKLDDGHFQVALPWRQDPPGIPNSKPMAEKRLRSLQNRLENDGELFEKYTNTMQDYINKGHAQRVPKEELEKDD